ncbi:unnamed protein product [Cylicocyclus nassatus]|uniref:Uncharacterized protein n=1 Tax=Cylicocyclus nassatus TaxID=53992 RepID=A0AA36HF42_CYLNA|nr:unnamed protein product [Cylicocyclus nassatus]
MPKINQRNLVIDRERMTTARKTFTLEEHVFDEKSKLQNEWDISKKWKRVFSKEKFELTGVATSQHRYNFRVVEKSRENTDYRDVLPKRKTRRPLVDRKNGSQEDVNSADSKEEEQ